MVQEGDESFGESFAESFVYEEFSGIRSAFEQLIDRHGYEAIETTMRKVVHVLEKFETLISYKRQADLRLANADLRLEEEKEASFHHKKVLSRKINVLKEQNASLSDRNTEIQKQLKEKRLKDAQNSQKEQEESIEAVETREVLDKLNAVIAAQNQTISELRDEYEEISAHSSKQSALILKLKAGLQESVHSHKALKARNDILCNETATQQALISAHERGRESPTDNQESSSKSDCRSSCDSLEEKTKSELEGSEDKDIHQAKMEYKRSATLVIRDVLNKYSPSSRRRQSNKCQCELSGYKFTVDEMTLLINERNMAKEKMLTAEEELSFYRDQETTDVLTEEGFAILEPPPPTSPMAHAIFRQLSRPGET